ncbi:MAG: DUF3800 domain-containing protein [Phenylobacterium sp.]|uniref:DUF3800 domain-containing protein n=1 Tax=Phenylobacterium sp. TaxID=1871053 RepID=UPI002723485D|nr:DUF3800 domain-containing protein [Phenylobacterium sp.]MDO8900137.1 DUF3800 domain-containing protein [Phenylobacterium sp.]
MAKPPIRAVYYFCDESSYVDDDFMAVAGLAVPDRELEPITAELAAIKQQAGALHEVKWSTAKKRKDNVHAAFIDYFQELIETKRAHFHIRFAPFGKYDHKLSGPKRRADTVSKMHYQLLLHRAVHFYGPHYRLRIRPDGGDCTSALAAQVGNLHTWGQHKYRAADDCIQDVQCMDSKRELLLQLLDVPLGGFTAIRNDRHIGGLGEVKTDLAERLTAAFPGKNMRGNSNPKVMTFNVWNVTPKWPSERGPWR